MSTKRIFLAFLITAVMAAMVTVADAQSSMNGIGPKAKKPKDVTGSWIVEVSPTIQPYFVGLVTFTPPLTEL